MRGKRVFRFPKETKCEECGWETTIVYVLAENEKDAKERFEEGDYVCGECMADTIAGSGFLILEGKDA